MNSEAIRKLVSDLHVRVAGREHALKTIKAKAKHGTLMANQMASEAVNQAHIDELEYVIEKLGEILPKEA
jgi:hypothetical protein